MTLKQLFPKAIIIAIKNSAKQY